MCLYLFGLMLFLPVLYLWLYLWFQTKQQGSISVDGGPIIMSGDPNLDMDVPVLSNIFLGGIKPNSDAAKFLENNQISHPSEGEKVITAKFQGLICSVCMFSAFSLEGGLPLTWYNMAAVSCGTRHVSTPGGYSKTLYKKLFTHVESHANAVSLLKSGE